MANNLGLQTFGDNSMEGVLDFSNVIAIKYLEKSRNILNKIKGI